MALFNKKTTTTKQATPQKEQSMKELYSDVPAKNSSKQGTVGGSRTADILVRPLISEKASHQQALNQYFFAVRLNANRVEVAKAVKALYGVTPTKVTIIRQEGKLRRYGRTTGKQKDWKKAMVSLPKGKTISLYEGV